MIDYYVLYFIGGVLTIGLIAGKIIIFGWGSNKKKSIGDFERECSDHHVHRGRELRIEDFDENEIRKEYENGRKSGY